MLITTLVDTFINVTKRSEFVLYRGSVAPSAVNISYVSTSDIDVPTCLSLADRSTALAANRAVKTNYTTITGTRVFDIDTDIFVVTDIFVTPKNTITSTPLFYKHIINITNLPRVSDESLELGSGVRLLDVQILDTTFTPIQVTELLLDEEQGILYNNLAPYFKAIDKYEYYYVKYTVNNNNSIHTFIDLVDNQAVYQIAEFSDLDSGLQIIVDGRKVYLIDETTTGFQVTLPIRNTYAFKPLNIARIQALPPVSSSPTEPWYVRVTNGSFYTVVNAQTCKYYIAEFSNQSFYPQYPFKRVQPENAQLINKTTVKLSNINTIEDETLEMGVSLIINDFDGNGIAAFTTLETFEGSIATNGKVFQRWAFLSPIGIRSIDHVTGIVDIDGLELKDDWTITADYYYSETAYVYSLINFNPTSNRSILNNKIVLFTIPDYGPVTQTQTIYYLKVDQSGKVVESNWPLFDNEEQAVFVTGTGWVSIYYGDAPAWKAGTPFTNVNFITECTVNGTGTPIGALPDIIPNYLVLAEIVVATGSNVENTITIDSRKRGGGIVEERFLEASQAVPEAVWAWDVGYWDGLPYPGNSTYLVEVPVEVLDGAGGIFTQQQLKDIVLRHTANGTYPVIRAYGTETTLSGLSDQIQRFAIEWDGHRT